MSSNPALDLHEACRRGNLQGALECVERSGDVETPTSRGETPLWLACKFDHPELARALVERGASVTTSDNHGELALALICQHGHVDLFKFIEASLKVACPEFIRDNHGQLFLAACKGECIEMIEYTLTVVAGGDIVTALLAACEEGIDGVLQHIVRLHGVFHAACEGGPLEVVRFLIEQGANPAAISELGQTSLHYACVGGQLGIVKHLVGIGCDCKAKDFKGLTPLHMACLQGSVDLVMYLVEQGADINEDCDDEVSGLDLVCHEGHLAVVKYLVEADRVDDINTALYAACEGGHLEVIEFLIQHGADIHFQHEFGETVLFAACQNSHQDVLRFLEHMGANLLAATSDNSSLLHAAAETGHQGIVEYLVERGCRPDCRTDEGKTPLHSAYEYDHTEITAYLIQALLKDLMLCKIQDISDMCALEVDLEAHLDAKTKLSVKNVNITDLPMMLGDNWSEQVSFRLRQKDFEPDSLYEGGTKNDTSTATGEPLEKSFELDFRRKEDFMCVGTVSIGFAAGCSVGSELHRRLHDSVLVVESNPSDTFLSFKKMSI